MGWGGVKWGGLGEGGEKGYYLDDEFFVANIVVLVSLKREVVGWVKKEL